MSDGTRLQTADSSPGQRVLLCEVASVTCGLALECVVETMRALPFEPIHGAPSFVRGVSIIRDKPVPVVDLATLFGASIETRPGRFVLMKVAERRVALAVNGVLGIRTLPVRSLHALPPLLAGAPSEFVGALGSLDAQLLIVLESGRIVPESSWAEFELAGASA